MLCGLVVEQFIIRAVQRDDKLPLCYIIFLLLPLQPAPHYVENRSDLD